jgi:hypothetical protein
MPLHWFIPPVVVETDEFGQSYAASRTSKKLARICCRGVISGKGRSGARRWRSA